MEVQESLLDGQNRSVVGGPHASRQPPWPRLVAASCQQTIHGNVFIQQRLGRLSKEVQESSDPRRDLVPTHTLPTVTCQPQ